jgi:hypothetical protein
MILINDHISEDDQLLSELKDKVDTETVFLKDLRRFFDKVLSEMHSDIRREAKALPGIKKKEIDITAIFGDELFALLTNNYKNGMTKGLDRFINDPTVISMYSKAERRRILDELIAKMEAYANRRASFIGPEIIATTEKNLAQAKTFVNNLIEQEGLSVSEEEQASMVMDDLTRRVINRTETIAITETQNVYQTAKQISSGFVANKLSEVGHTMQKRWNATLDQKTRIAHANAHGQRVPTEQLYTVGGEYLMFPGDTSHGATLENIINCRCESIFVLITEVAV